MKLLIQVFLIVLILLAFSGVRAQSEDEISPSGIVFMPLVKKYHKPWYKDQNITLTFAGIDHQKGRIVMAGLTNNNCYEVIATMDARTYSSGVVFYLNNYINPYRECFEAEHEWSNIIEDFQVPAGIFNKSYWMIVHGVKIRNIEPLIDFCDTVICRDILRTTAPERRW